MRRSGSPLTGAGAVVAKETADYLSGTLIVIVELIVFLLALATVYFAIDSIRKTIGESPFLFLRLMTMAADPAPFAFYDLLGILIPIFAIVLGFDAINGEFSRRTLSRVLAQPIYRDALLLGKFLSGLLTLTIVLVSLWLLVIGLGLLFLGVPPGAEEIVRMFGFLLATIAYGGVWFALALLFSVVFRSPATAVLCALGMWLVLTFFWPLFVTPVLAGVIAGPPETIFGPNLAYVDASQTLLRISPNGLYGEVALALLQPAARTTGAVLLYTRGMLLGAPLPAGQSFILVWPQLTSLVAAMILIFAIAYVLFQRQEIRA
jgi:ABC-2 type transport system permease protein